MPLTNFATQQIARPRLESSAASRRIPALRELVTGTRRWLTRCRASGHDACFKGFCADGHNATKKPATESGSGPEDMAIGARRLTDLQSRAVRAGVASTLRVVACCRIEIDASAWPHARAVIAARRSDDATIRLSESRSWWLQLWTPRATACHIAKRRRAAGFARLGPIDERATPLVHRPGSPILASLFRLGSVPFRLSSSAALKLPKITP